MASAFMTRVAAPRTRRSAPRAITPGLLIVVLAAHSGLALLIHAVPGLGRLHALAVVAVGFVALSQRRLELVACVSAYLAGAEMIWRVSRAPLFYEFSKYATIMLLGIALLVCFRHGRRRYLAIPVAFVGLLLPSALLTLDQVGVGRARELISFALTGPIALAVAVLFFAQLKATRASFARVIWSMIVPIAGVAAIVLVETLGSGDVKFDLESNFVTSGGFGPVQVSAALGLGALLALLLALHERAVSLRFIELALALWFVGQSALTFSRGGLVSAGIAGLVLLLHYVWTPRAWFRLLSAVGALLLVAGAIVLPRLDQFTEGALGDRFGDRTSSGRSSLAEEDIRIWRDNVIAGVGPGVTREVRTDISGASSHTEFTRLLAEHGLMGAAAAVLLLVMAGSAYQRTTTAAWRGFIAALLAWSLAQMVYANLRVSLVAFVFGVAMTRVELGTARKTSSPAGVGELAPIA